MLHTLHNILEVCFFDKSSILNLNAKASFSSFFLHLWAIREDSLSCFSGIMNCSRWPHPPEIASFCSMTASWRLTKKLKLALDADIGHSRDIEDAGEQLKTWQKHLAKLQRGEAAPLLPNQACDAKNPECENGTVPASHTSPSSMSKQLRRVIMQYGLEYGPPSGPLLRIHHGPLRKHGKYVRRVAAAAVVSLVGIVCLGTATLGLRSGNQSAVSAIGLSVGRKLLTICKDPRTPWIKDIGTMIGYASCSKHLPLAFMFMTLCCLNHWLDIVLLLDSFKALYTRRCTCFIRRLLNYVLYEYN